MRYLVTGGCGFIGSHLVEALLAAGHQVVALDDLSTGRLGNLSGVTGRSDLEVVVGSVTDEALTKPLVASCDSIFHLASAVGVRLIMQRPIESIDTIVRGTQTVLRLANQYRRPVLITSTSEVYGKSENVPFDEDGDRLEGPTTKLRWAYACAKALDEFIAIAYWRTESLPIVVARLFNTVGPRQTGRYGMVVPNFVEFALAGKPLPVFGTGNQTRCFCHVADVVGALIRLIDCPAAYGEVVNIGSSNEITIRQLAEQVIHELQSSSTIEIIPYSNVFGEGFEDMFRRLPKIEKVFRLIGWKPLKDLSQIISDVARECSIDSRAAL